MGKETSSKRILLVEDDPGLSRLVRKHLERDGQKVDAAASGQAAMEFLQRDADVLMLVDYQLGDMNAIELLNRLEDQGLTVPFIMVTGQGSEFVAVESMKRGARDYVIKDTTFPGILTPVVSRVQEEIEIEEKLQRIEQALRMEKTHLLNHIPDLVFQIDENGKILSLNPAVQSILGYPEKSLIGKSIYSLVYSEDVKTVRQDFRSVMKGQAILRHPIRFVSEEGQLRWLEGNIVAIYDEQGAKACGISGIYQDITETRQANERLRQAKERIGLLVDVSPNLILEVDLQGKVLSMNRSAREYFSLVTLEQDPSKCFLWDYFAGETAGRVQEAFEQWSRLENQKITLPVNREDGSSQWLEMTISPIRDDPGEVTSVLVTAWDITERVRREVEIRQSLEREEKVAREAKILQRISLSAGSGVEIEPDNVIRSSLRLLSHYLKLKWISGYMFLSEQEVRYVGEDGEDPDGLYRQQVAACLACMQCRKMLTPARECKDCRGISATSVNPPGSKGFYIVPLVHGGTVYGMLFMVESSPKLLEQSLAFLRSVSRCAGLAVANSRMLQRADGRLKSRIQQLEGFGETAGYACEVWEDEGLDAVLESAVHVVRAKGGLVLTRCNENQFAAAGEYGLDLGQGRTVLIDLQDIQRWESYQKNVSVYIEDIHGEENFSCGMIEGFVEESLMCFPLREADRIFGFMLILDPSDVFDLRYMEVLESYARLAEQSIRVHSLIGRAREMDVQFGRIRKLAGQLSSSEDLPGFLNTMCESVCRICSCRMAWIGLVSRNGQQLRGRGRYGQADFDLEKTNFHIDTLLQNEPKLADVLVEGESLVREPGMGDEYDSLDFDMEYPSRCCVPIQDHGRICGMLCVYDHRLDAFTLDHIHVLEEFCNAAGYALSNLELKQTLSESESLRQIILQSVNEALLVIDSSGTIISSNLAAGSLFGGNDKPLSGMSCRELCLDDNPLCRLVQTWMEDHQASQSQEGWTQLPGTGRVYLSAESRQVMIEEVACLLLTIQDLTFQKKMNASLEHAAKLSTAGRIAAQISHEINNPLTLVSSQLQRMTRENKADPEQLKHLLIHVDRISQLTKRFSDLQSRAPLSKRVCSFTPVLENILVLVENSKPFQGITIHKEIEGNLPPVEIDSNKIMQVILNLMINAADACSEDGQVNIHVYSQSIRMEGSAGSQVKDYLVFSIGDNGCGMNSEQMAHIFEPFFTSKESGHGTGLGLSVSLSIIDQHHGWIHVDSEEEKGSTFSVFLPSREKHSRRQIRDIEMEKVYNANNVNPAKGI